MAKKNVNYTDSIREIEQILERFRNEEMDVDRLTDDLKRASELIARCRERLTQVEGEVNQLLEER